MVILCKNLENERFDLNFPIKNRKRSFLNVRKYLLDVVIMEKTNLGTVLPLDVGWSDIGSWESLWKLFQRIN